MLESKNKNLNKGRGVETDSIMVHTCADTYKYRLRLGYLG